MKLYWMWILSLLILGLRLAANEDIKVYITRSSPERIIEPATNDQPICIADQIVEIEVHAPHRYINALMLYNFYELYPEAYKSQFKERFDIAFPQLEAIYNDLSRLHIIDTAKLYTIKMMGNLSLWEQFIEQRTAEDFEPHNKEVALECKRKFRSLFPALCEHAGWNP